MKLWHFSQEINPLLLDLFYSGYTEDPHFIYVNCYFIFACQWSPNERYGVWSHRCLVCSLSRLFRRIWNKTSKLRVTGLCEGNSPVTGEFPAQRASNAENVSNLWRHHGMLRHCYEHVTNTPVPEKQLWGVCINKQLSSHRKALNHAHVQCFLRWLDNNVFIISC